jgi:cytidine deaminase
MQDTKLLTAKNLQILEKARQHIKRKYKDGLTSIAAVLTTKKGGVYTGINLKYKKIWKCICAEKVAIAKAVEQGESELDTIVSVKYVPEENKYFVVNMCGECRQIAFCYKSLRVIVDDKGILRAVSINKTFPFPLKL